MPAYPAFNGGIEIHFGIAPVSGLLYRSGPTTITRLVIPVVVFSFQRSAFGPFSHIGKKVLK